MTTFCFAGLYLRITSTITGIMRLSPKPAGYQASYPSTSVHLFHPRSRVQLAMVGRRSTFQCIPLREESYFGQLNYSRDALHDSLSSNPSSAMSFTKSSAHPISRAPQCEFFFCLELFLCLVGCDEVSRLEGEVERETGSAGTSFTGDWIHHHVARCVDENRLGREGQTRGEAEERSKILFRPGGGAGFTWG